MQNLLMYKSFSFFKIFKIKNKINVKDLNSIVSLIKIENKYSILARLNNKIVKNYIHSVLSSKNFFLYILKKKREVIGYALLVKHQKYLSEIMESKKFLILIDLLSNLRFITLLNLLALKKNINPKG